MIDNGPMAIDIHCPRLPPNGGEAMAAMLQAASHATGPEDLADLLAVLGLRYRAA